MTKQLIDRAAAWLRHDPDPRTRTELAALISAAQAGAAEALAELASRFSGPLAFGTAGLRGAVAAGESRMNVAVVARATAGVAGYLLAAVGPDARVVVGCDARHGSDDFYDVTTEVLAGAGLQVLALPRRLPTPITAYAVRALAADAGIMITASHNPPADNGYKVYLGGRASTPEGRGVQIVPPADAEIAARIAAAPAADQIPRTTDRIQSVGDDLVAAYVMRMAGHRASPEPARIKVVLTALHGVGGALAQRVLQAARIDRVEVVSQQIDPDPDFPTLSFPNPEEPGAIDLAIATAVEVRADLVIALDPDADRCSIAIPLADGRWRQLTGDEIGALLGQQAAIDSGRDGDTLAASVVSSRLLGKIALRHGLRHAVTLTGFKWIARAPGIRFGYEEAIGYCTDPAAVRDKDGIGAMVYLIELVDELARTGRTVTDALDELAHSYGLHATSQLSFRVRDLSLISAAMTQLRTDGIDQLAGSPVTSTQDLATGSAELPPTDGLLFLTAAGDRVIVRPSGTEPKLKCYLEVILPCAGGQVPRADATARLDRIKADLGSLLRL